jgi:hypothetical protein
MKKTTIITVLILSIAGITLITGCENKRNPGRIYMPDMAYSRAMETYDMLDSTSFTSDNRTPGAKIFYNRKPVDGTIERNELFPYTLPNDSAGYAMSAQVKNPLPPLTGIDSLEAARLFNINCAICHGANGQATGPLAVSGKVGAIANLTLPQYVAMADGTMFHSIQYGKNNMGSYASQLTRKQRWQMVHYIRNLQPKPAAPEKGTTPSTGTSTGPAADSAATNTAK